MTLSTKEARASETEKKYVSMTERERENVHVQYVMQYKNYEYMYNSKFATN